MADDEGSGGGDSLAYLKPPGFAKLLSAAMDDFAEALTYRWREVVTDGIISTTDDFPTRFRRWSSEFDQPMWEYWTSGPAFHLSYYGDKCAYVKWVKDGQNGSLAGVTCDGVTDPISPNSESRFVDENGQPVPKYIQCGMGSILQMVEDWAQGEREAIFNDLLTFDGNDVNAIERAYDTFIDVGGKLGLTAGPGSTGMSFPKTGEDDLVGTVKALSPVDASSQDWWAGWTGLAADNAKSGFFSSVAPTLNNQAGIAGVLANLYAARAAIIVQARNDALYWTQWATKSLKETQTITTNLVPGWKAMQGIGSAIAIPGSFYPPVAAVGATITLIGFLGENLLPRGTSEGYAFELTDAMTRFGSEVDKLRTSIDGLETEYATLVRQLRETIWSLHSFNLELYDLTENSPRGDHTSADAGSYTADVGDILRIAEFCYKAGDAYGSLRTSYSGIADADAHLTGKDGAPTEGDVALIEVRDQLGSFIETACGRYLLAGDQTRASAEEYAKVESDQKGEFDRTMADWDKHGIGDHGVDPGKLADDTDRGDKPNPTASDAPAPTGDGEDYVTDKNP